MPLNPKEITGRLKPSLGMIPSGALIPVCQVLQHGADKYGPFNWRETPVEAMTYVHAAIRHLYAFIDGETIDPESGLPHLAHVAAGCCIALDAASVGNLHDNRPAGGRASELIAAACVTSSEGNGGPRLASDSKTTGDGASPRRRQSRLPKGK